MNYIIKVEKDNEAGNAVLKSWDKNSKKEYKMAVSKQKGFDVNVDKTFANVIKTLLHKSISGEGWSKMKLQNTIKCVLCDKLFSSESYLKGHLTRIHTTFKESSPGPQTCTKCNKKFTY